MPKYFIPSGTKVKVCERVDVNGVRWGFKYTKKDVVYDDTDTMTKYDWGIEFFLPQEADPFEIICAENDQMEIR